MNKFLIIHDNDNNLVNEEVVFYAYHSIMIACGIKPENLPKFNTLTKDYAGKHYVYSLKDLENKHNFKVTDFFTDYKSAYETIIIQEQAEHLKLLPGVAGALTLFHKAGIIQCIATNNSRPVVENGYRLLGVTNYFSSITSGDDVPSSEHKPSPMLLQIAMNKHGVTPDEAVHIEDSNSGLEAGFRANIKNLVWHDATVPSDLYSERVSQLEQKGISPATVIHDYTELVSFVLKIAPLEVAKTLNQVIDELTSNQGDRIKNAVYAAEQLNKKSINKSKINI